VKNHNLHVTCTCRTSQFAPGSCAEFNSGGRRVALTALAVFHHKTILRAPLDSKFLDQSQKPYQIYPRKTPCISLEQRYITRIDFPILDGFQIASTCIRPYFCKIRWIRGSLPEFLDWFPLSEQCAPDHQIPRIRNSIEAVHYPSKIS